MKIIAGHELIPGTVTRDYVHVDGTELEVPYVLIAGVNPGPTMLITAGVHNAEFVGIQAAIELSCELDPSIMSGNVAIVTLANRSGFEHRTMSMVYEDGKNLNRVFPGDPQGTVADRLAYTIFETFIKQADYHIDLHCGDGFESLTPYAYFLGENPTEEASFKMVACADIKYAVRSTRRGGGAYSSAAASGVPSMLLERGQLSLLVPEEVRADKADVCNILRCLGILPGDYVEYPTQIMTCVNEVAPYTGCWYPAKKVAETFCAGEVLGELRDYFGELLFTLVAREDGTILHQTSSLNIMKDSPMLTYGIPYEE